MNTLSFAGEISDDDNLQKSTSNGLTAKQHLTVEEIAAQSVTFFGAGFETSSTAISFTLLELSLNPHVQDKLRKEVQEYLKKHDDFTYEGLMNELTYLDQVVNGKNKLRTTQY